MFFLGGGDYVQAGQSITLDFLVKNHTKLIAKQNDINSRYIKATLKNNRQDVTISPYSVVTLNITRQDGQKKCYRARVEDNIAVAFLGDWAVELAGIIQCDISVIEREERLTTMPFKIEIVLACCTSDDIEDTISEDVMLELIHMLEEYEGERDHIERIDSRLESVENAVADNTSDISDISSDVAILKDIVDKIKNPISSQVVTIMRDDWEYNASTNKYEYIESDDTVTSETYIIANEFGGVLYDADIVSNDGSYIITAPVKPTGAVNLLLIFLKGG